MENNVQTFVNKKFGSVRVASLEGEPWFLGKDIAAVLGYKDSNRAILQHVDREDKRVLDFKAYGDSCLSHFWDSPSDFSNKIIINESGLYDLIFASALPDAKSFRHWVTAEVLPSIRKTGGYQEPLTGEELMAKALLEAKNVLNDLKIKNSELTVENQILKPKGEYFDELVDRNLLTNLTDTAKELGIKRKVLINFCLENRYLYRAQKKGTLMPYQKHVQEGLFELKECFNEKSTWKGLQTMVTPKGRETFRLILGKGE